MNYKVTDHPPVIPTEWEAWNEERQRTGIMGETSKARSRREKEQFEITYAPHDLSGIDIGCSDDPLNHTFRRWDLVFGDGDATEMEGVPDEKFWTVYASHVLEHLQYPRRAIKRWWDICKTGGYIIICVPHRDLYEKKKMLPSQWNIDHKYFWHPDHEEPPCTKCLKKEILEATPRADIVSYRILQDGYDYSMPNDHHPIGEYSIEAIIKKV
jgi:SAM-dependent methyltransferase